MFRQGGPRTLGILKTRCVRLGLWGLPPKMSMAVRRDLVSLNREVGVEWMFAERETCVHPWRRTIPGDDRVWLCVRRMQGGLCSLYGQAARCRKRIFCCRRPYFFCKFLMSNGFFFLLFVDFLRHIFLNILQDYFMKEKRSFLSL